MGRPSSYKEEYAEQAYKLCLLGATDKDMADFFEVSEQTINAWKKKQPSFIESLKKGKVMADSNVAQKLYKRANGYEYTEKKIERDADSGKVFKETLTTKQVAADTTAQIFWLKNRQPDKWRDKQEFEHSETSAEAVDTWFKNNIEDK